MYRKIIFVFVSLVTASTSVLSAHEGRRLDIQVINNKLFAQGYIGGGTDDGGGSPRPYYNAIHDHWSNVGGSAAFATLPGFAVLDPSFLLGFDVTIKLVGAQRWDNPTHGPGVIPTMSDFTGERVEISRGANSIDTNNLGESLMLFDNLAGAEDDIDLNYVIDRSPSDTIYALEWQLSTNKPGIDPSSSVWTLLSPDPDVGGLHHQSLHFERFLGVTVPEPSSFALIGLGSGIFACNRRRRTL